MNSELQLAWQLVQNTSCNVFLTGKAGTGKTTFLRELYAQTHKRAVVLAPTGIAAINAHGSTLHSFFQLPFGPYIPGTDPRSNERNFKFSEKKRQLIRTLDLMIIDEISMVRPDLLDSVDAVLRRYKDHTKPFGGVQLLMIGDLQQLAPVTKPEEWEMLRQYYPTQYFFSSLALKEAGFTTIELKKVYRQSDQHFIDLLNKIRNNQIDANVLQELNAHYRPDFNPSPDEGYIHLTTHNWQADQINQRELDALETEPHTYVAEIWREFPEMSYPTPYELVLKVGAQVMFVKNDSSNPKRYYNGMIGRVVSMGNSIVRILPQDGEEIIEVTAEEWENTRYTINEETKEIEEDVLGTFKQMPLKTAWAITVHKSQGLTFERAIIDVQHSFSHGQTYVALSRCKNLEGMVLSSPIPPSAIICDQQVVAFNDNIERQLPTADKVNLLQREYFIELFADLFTFHAISNSIYNLVRRVDEWLSGSQPEQVERWKAAQNDFRENVEKVSVTFSLQYQKIISADFNYASNATLQERAKKGAAWFLKQLNSIKSLLKASSFVSNNKMAKSRLDDLKKDLEENLRQKIVLLTSIERQGFSVEQYLHDRQMATFGANEKKTKKKGKASFKNTKEIQQAVNELLQKSNSYDLDEETDYATGCVEEYLAAYADEMPDFDFEGLPY